MNLEINQDLKSEAKRSERFHFTKRGLLNSNYKRLVKKNFRKSRAKSIFATRQRLKSLRSYKVSETAVILKVSIFALAFIALI